MRYYYERFIHSISSQVKFETPACTGGTKYTSRYERIDFLKWMITKRPFGNSKVLETKYGTQHYLALLQQFRQEKRLEAVGHLQFLELLYLYNCLGFNHFAAQYILEGPGENYTTLYNLPNRRDAYPLQPHEFFHENRQESVVKYILAITQNSCRSLVKLSLEAFSARVWNVGINPEWQGQMYSMNISLELSHQVNTFVFVAYGTPPKTTVSFYFALRILQSVCIFNTSLSSRGVYKVSSVEEYLQHPLLTSSIKTIRKQPVSEMVNIRFDSLIAFVHTKNVPWKHVERLCQIQNGNLIIAGNANELWRFLEVFQQLASFLQYPQLVYIGIIEVQVLFHSK